MQLPKKSSKYLSEKRVEAEKIFKQLKDQTLSEQCAFLKIGDEDLHFHYNRAAASNPDSKSA